MNSLDVFLFRTRLRIGRMKWCLFDVVVVLLLGTFLDAGGSIFVMIFFIFVFGILTQGLAEAVDERLQNGA